MGAEARQRQHLKDLLATTAVWESWTGLNDEEQRKARIAWPSLLNEQLPGITISLGPSERESYPPGAGKSGFRAKGALAVLVFDHVDSEASLQAEDDRIVGLVSDLVDQLATHPTLTNGTTRMSIRRIYFDPAWITRTNLNTQLEVDSEGDVEGIWQAMFFVEWGPFR